MTIYQGTVGLVLGALMASSLAGAASFGDSTISNMAGPWPIQIRTCAKFAGAICSLTWRNKEFIDTRDHGRELQSASNFSPNPEAYNPTEAGSAWDGARPTSSSKLQGLWTAGNVVATQTQMAFWLRPGEVSGGGVRAENTTILSDHVLNKQVTIGIPGMAHVIEYRTQFSLPNHEVHSMGTFETVTGYMPTEFSKFYTYNVTTKQLTSLSDGPGEQSIPIIFSTPDQGWAMGIYTPSSQQANQRVGTYGRWRFNDVVKWNTVFRVPNPFGTYHFVSYVVVGSLENVRVSMDQLHARFN